MARGWCYFIFLRRPPCCHTFPCGFIFHKLNLIMWSDTSLFSCGIMLDHNNYSLVLWNITESSFWMCDQSILCPILMPVFPSTLYNKLPIIFMSSVDAWFSDHSLYNKLSITFMSSVDAWLCDHSLYNKLSITFMPHLDAWFSDNSL